MPYLLVQRPEHPFCPRYEATYNKLLHKDPQPIMVTETQADTMTTTRLGPVHKQRNEWCFRLWNSKLRLYWARNNLANEMNFGINHTLSAGLITRPVGLQDSMLPLCHTTSHTNQQNIS